MGGFPALLLLLDHFQRIRNNFCEHPFRTVRSSILRRTEPSGQVNKHTSRKSFQIHLPAFESRYVVPGGFHQTVFLCRLYRIIRHETEIGDHMTYAWRYSHCAGSALKLDTID